jgi:YD repeat-containing protein
VSWVEGASLSATVPSEASAPDRLTACSSTSSAGRPSGRVLRRVGAALCTALLLTSCTSTPPPSTPTPTRQPSPSQGPPASPTQGPISATPTALDECDPAGYVPCDQQAAVLSIPIADTNLALTYSSQWASARQDRPNWNADSLGLGGWSIDALQRYDTADGVLLAGDGSWRFATGRALAAGGQAVPSFDGSVAYVFDAAGHHIQTVNGRLGTTLLTLSYDAAGRLSTVDGSVAGQPAHLTVERSAEGTPTALIGIDGASTSLQLDANGQLVGVRSPGGGATSISWAPGGLVTSETDPVGGVSRFSYDQAGRLASSTDDCRRHGRGP